MLGLWRHTSHSSTSAMYWRRLYVTSGSSLAPSPSSRLPVTPAMNQPEVMSIEFDMRNSQKAYASKSSAELVRAYVVFTLCSYKTLLKYQKELLNISRRLLGRRLFRRVMRMSVFGQFIAGEHPDEIIKVARQHHIHGVRPMFAYTASEQHGAAEGMLGSKGREELFNNNHVEMQKCIEMTKLAPKFPKEYVKMTGKLTALGSSKVFRDMTTLTLANTEIVKVAREKAGTSEPWKNILDVVEQLVTSQGIGSISQVAKETGLPLPANYKTLDWQSLITCQTFNLAMSRSTKLACLLKTVDGGATHCCPLSANIEGELLSIWRRMDDLAERSKRADVCLVVDAEQTYLQVAMDSFTLDLMRKHNTTRPVVHNTYQCYLRRTYDVIIRDFAIADAEGFMLGAKVVRGAYLDEERALAAELGVPDPVNPTMEATTAMYYRVAEQFLTKQAEGATVQVTFATHNEETVQHILRLMRLHGTSPDPNVFSFAQLIGMRDHIAFCLGEAKLPAQKLLHYGDVEECVAYLSRRISENQAGIPTAHAERVMFATEIRRRLRSGEFFGRKSVK